jgi:predicted Zn-dependent protease
LDKLEEIGDGPGLAFFSLRKCDIALRSKNRNDALLYSKRAIEYVPSLPSAHAARVKALMLNGQSDEAFTQIKAMERLDGQGNKKNGWDQLVLIQVRFNFNLRKERIDLCRADVENMARFDPEQAKAMKLDIIGAVHRMSKAVDPELAAWLKR